MIGVSDANNSINIVLQNIDDPLWKVLKNNNVSKNLISCVLDRAVNIWVHVMGVCSMKFIEYIKLFN